MTAPLLSSFEIDALEAAQEAAPELPRGLLLDEWRDDWRELTTRLGCVSIHLNHKLLDAGRVASLKQAGCISWCIPLTNPSAPPSCCAGA